MQKTRVRKILISTAFHPFYVQGFVELNNFFTFSVNFCSLGLANKRKQAEEMPAEPNIMHMTII